MNPLESELAGVGDYTVHPTRRSVVSPDSVWYARVLLVFSASAMTDTGSKSFECALVSTLETYYDPENGKDDYYTHYSK